MHEPLFLAFSFPFARFKPWTCRATPKLVYMEREVQKMWKEKGLDAGSMLRKFWLELRDLPVLSEHLVRSLLFFE